MDKQRLAEIRERAEKANKRPWRAEFSRVYIIGGGFDLRNAPNPSLY
jgi:hypothetical protein